MAEQIKLVVKNAFLPQMREFLAAPAQYQFTLVDEHPYPTRELEATVLAVEAEKAVYFLALGYNMAALFKEYIPVL